ncbi:hypothetical protein [Paenibacillus xerothermodurans]|uniref:hypothetical protein n=1 Tax=Paenibacillus xerothermodurans TaxID=1977292 RepID=UPI0014020AE3|nr:hypothetical protein [Paenibacillus xerothermodurans]
MLLQREDAEVTRSGTPALVPQLAQGSANVAAGQRLEAGLAGWSASVVPQLPHNAQTPS